MLKRYAPLMLLLASASFLTGCCCLFPVTHTNHMPLPGAMGEPGADRDEVRVKATSAHLAALTVALDMFEIDCGRYPTKKEGLVALLKNSDIENWMGPYIRDERAIIDSWGTPPKYIPRKNSYTILSAGPDGAFETGDDIHPK